MLFRFFGLGRGLGAVESVTTKSRGALWLVLLPGF